ncbi:putative protein kinase RLK-Pelle-PERK-1 family [Helianthus annuus]|nr:putative protein kinase RLK-Pelle-PERK-1 family [Helianthus annuus]
MPPVPPPASGPVSSEFSWVAAPPPPPPGMLSSEFNSSTFSGPYQAPLPPPHPTVALGFNKNTFTYDELAAATRGFDHSLLIGQGGFGYVYKGILPNGKEVAIKSLKSTSGKGSPLMNGSTRLNIALGAAKGFAYLHEDCEPRIIHRDVKAANILIDEHYEAKVSDFGLAKLSTDTNTHVSTRVMGTFGYLAPEYASTGKLTDKSDVFSFGVVLLELITGRRPADSNSDDDSLIDWARPILEQAVEGGSYVELLDKRIENNYTHEDMNRMVVCASACLQYSARRRPKMSQVCYMFNGPFLVRIT